MPEIVFCVASCKRGFERTIPVPAECVGWIGTERSVIVVPPVVDPLCHETFFPECEFCEEYEPGIALTMCDDHILHLVRTCLLRFRAADDPAEKLT